MAQTTHTIVQALPKSLALVDLSYLFRKHWHAMAEDAEINTAPRNVLDDLLRIKERVDHVIVCLDSAPYWRSEVDPQYKAHRPPVSDACKAQLKWLKARIEQDGYSVASAPKMEADDVIASLASQYLGLGVADVRIVGADKDMMQLVCTGVRVLVPGVGVEGKEGYRPEKLYDGPAVMEKFKVPPAMMVDYLTLLGDKSDNVPGCPGVGEVTAAKLMCTYGTLQMVLSAAQRGESEIKPAVAKALVASTDRLKLSRKLIELRKDVDLDVWGLLEKKAPKPLVKVETVDAEFEDHRGTESELAARDTSAGDVISGEPVRPLPPAPKPVTTALAKPKAANDVVKTKWGTVDENLQPMDMEALMVIAENAVNSRQNSKTAPTVASAVITIIRGRELGLTAIAALDSFNMIDGKISATADTIQTLAERDPNCEYIRCVKSTPTEAIYEFKHKKHPEPYVHPFTMEDAERAGLARNNNYRRYPAAMLRARCKAEGSRVVFPGSARGIYCPEELVAEREDG